MTFVTDEEYKNLVSMGAFVPKEKSAERLNICKTCIYNNEGWCKLCDCMLELKTAVNWEYDKNGLSKEGCPDNPPRW